MLITGFARLIIEITSILVKFGIVAVASAGDVNDLAISIFFILLGAGTWQEFHKSKGLLGKLLFLSSCLMLVIGFVGLIKEITSILK